MLPASSASAALSAQRWVLDTNVWLDLLLFKDPRCTGLHRMLIERHAFALTNSECRSEWLRVLDYPALRLSVDDADRLRSAFDALAVDVDAPLRPPPWPTLPRCRDPDDQKFLHLACAADATVLLSRDHALLTLSRRTQRAGLFRICCPEALQTI